MSDLELKREESLSRVETGKRLAAFAEALASGDDVELAIGGTSMSLRVPDDVRVKFELEVDRDEVEVEIEITWSTRSASGRAETASHSGEAASTPAADEPGAPETGVAVEHT